MTPEVEAVYGELVERAARAPYGSQCRELRRSFAERCGEFSPTDPAADARERAGWEDVLVQGGLARKLAEQLADPAERATALAIARAQRGIWVFETFERHVVARDLWSRAELLLAERDHVSRELSHGDLARESPVCQARLMPSPDGCLLLPGMIFHPIDARPAILKTLEAARARSLPSSSVLDALLRMEHAFRTLSRVKVAFAYRPEALPYV